MVHAIDFMQPDHKCIATHAQLIKCNGLIMLQCIKFVKSCTWVARLERAMFPDDLPEQSCSRAVLLRQTLHTALREASLF